MVDANTYYINKHLAEQDANDSFDGFKASLVDTLLAGNDVSGELKGGHEYSVDFDQVVELACELDSNGLTQPIQFEDCSFEELSEGEQYLLEKAVIQLVEGEF